MVNLPSEPVSIFEELPDEVLLDICKYLRGADILYSFYRLNDRLNRTITHYLKNVNLMSVSHQQFEYSVSKVLPSIGDRIRTFILNGNWETIICQRLHSLLFHSPFSDLFPSLERLILKWFSSERLVLLLDQIEDCQHLIELDVRYLRGQGDLSLLMKVLSSNRNRLKTVRFDQDSSDFDVASENNDPIVSENIEQLTVNLKKSESLPDVFHMIPNVRSLSLSIDELSEGAQSKKSLKKLTTLKHLSHFQLRSINLFWNHKEISTILKAMPSLKTLTLDLRTDDEKLIDENSLDKLLPRSLVKLDYFIRFYPSQYDTNTMDDHLPDNLRLASITKYPAWVLLDKPRNRMIYHTVPCRVRSLILPANISRKLCHGSNNFESVEDLCIYDVNCLLDIMLMLNHFRRVHSLTIDTKDRNKILESPPEIQTTRLKLPFLKQIDLSGIAAIVSLIETSPNLDYLIISFDCLKFLLEDQMSTNIMAKQITRLNVSEWIDKKDSNLLTTLIERFRFLRHLVITFKDPTVNIDDFILLILSLTNGKRKLSFDIKGSVSDQAKENIRQWVIDKTHLTEHDSFAIECKDNWFDLWY